MAERVIQKSLAGRQDILFGHGQVNQTRAGGLYPINKVSMVWACETHAELLTLDTTQFTQATISYQGAVTNWGWTGTHWYCQETDMTLVGSFEAGFTYTIANQVGCTASDIYSWDGNLPHAVTPGTDPSAPGSGYVPRTDVVLRDEITPSNTASDLTNRDVSLGKTYRTLGYYSVGDDGGAEYLATSEPPRAGADIVAVNGVTLRLQHGASVMSTKLGIRHDYNHVTKTGTDNTTRIQNAISFSAESGCEIVMAQGFALVTSALYPATGMKISGLGRGSGIVGSDALADSAIDCILCSKLSPSNPESFRIYNLHLHSDLTNAKRAAGKRIGGVLMDWVAQDGTSVRGGKKFRLDNCIFTEFKQFSFAGFGSIDSEVNYPVVENLSPYIVDDTPASGSGYDGITFSGSRGCWIRFARVTESGDSGVGMTADAMDGGIIGCTVKKLKGGAGPCLDMLGATGCVASGNTLQRDGVAYNNGTSCLQIGRKNSPNIGGFGNTVSGNICISGTNGGGALCFHCEGTGGTGESKNTVYGNEFIITGNPANPGTGLKRHVNLAADSCVLYGNKYATRNNQTSSLDPDNSFDTFVSSAIYAENANSCAISDSIGNYAVEIGSGCDGFTFSAPFECSLLYLHDGAATARTTKLIGAKLNKLQAVNLSGATVDISSSSISNFFGASPIEASGNVKIKISGGRIDRVTATNDVNAALLTGISEFISTGVQYVLSGGGTGVPVQALSGAPTKYFMKDNFYAGAFLGIFAGGIPEATSATSRYVASENYVYAQ